MTNRAEELITQLEAEIVKRDARIVELEKESIQDTKAINDLLASIHELKTQQPSGVVLPERMQEVRSWGHDMGGNYEEGLADGYNNAIDEVSRLNPCRAQAVPAMARALADRCADACNVNRDDYWKQYGDDCIEDVRAMLAAAPSAKPEKD